MGMIKRKEQVLDDVKENISVIAMKYPMVELGDPYEQLEEGLEALACCLLLGEAHVTKFQHHLIWSALARQYYLMGCAAEGLVDDFHMARSRSQAVFCALAAGDRALAIKVGDLAPSARIVDGEYADDFAYHWLVHLLNKDAGEATLRAALDDYKVALDGGPGERWAVCTALVDRDPAAFEEAFPELVEAHAALMAEEAPWHEDRPTFEPRAGLFVEGLGLLRLAEFRGVAPARPEYPPLCPSLARPKTLKTRPDDIFAAL
jgi:hypothetical protein